jgi:ethanolamine-phosphate phospho-lyase
MTRHQIIGDVRGRGLFIGFELVKNRETREPASTEAKKLVNGLLARNILLSVDGIHKNVIKIKPPMVITKEDVDVTLLAIDEVLRTME